MFLRNAWYLAAFADDVTQVPLARILLNDRIVLFRDHEGTVAALEDHCCHRGAPLSRGCVTDKGIMCGYHGLVFDRQGICVEIPGQSHIPPRARTRWYPTAEMDEFIWIWMGEPSQASHEDIVRFPHTPQSVAWPHGHARIHVEANYSLLLDNLMDLTHLPYLHSASIGGAPDDHVNAPMETQSTPTGVKFQRLIAETHAPPRYRSLGLEGRIDRWEEFEFVAPAIILQSTGAAEAGRGVIDKGLREGAHAVAVLHAATPETNTSTHYFFCVATSNAGGAEHAVDTMRNTFTEDAPMIESQQAHLAGYDKSRLVDIRSDVARRQMERFMEQRIAAEQRSDERPISPH